MMSRKVRIAAVQPPGGDFLTVFCPAHIKSREINSYVVNEGIELLKITAQEGNDIVCLPELFEIFGLEPDEAILMACSIEKNVILDRVRNIAREYKTYIILPLLEAVGNGQLYNSSVIIDRNGNIKGIYRKTHITNDEKQNLNVVAGDDYPVFQLDFGTIGIMTCWDSFFPEVARILTLKGAEILFYPRWQSGPSEITQEIQIRARAIDYSVYIVSSSFGIEHQKAWKPGMFFGKSKIISPDGIIIADAGHHAGTVASTIDLDKEVLMDVLDKGGDIRNLKQLNLEGRRPETYQEICKI